MDRFKQKEIRGVKINFYSYFIQSIKFENYDF